MCSFKPNDEDDGAAEVEETSDTEGSESAEDEDDAQVRLPDGYSFRSQSATPTLHCKI